MAITWAEIKTKMRPYILRVVDIETVEWITDSEFADIVNYVADALNEEAHINQHKYYQKSVSGQNYYEMSGDIIVLKQFKYIDSAFQSQQYAIVQIPYAVGDDNEGEYYSVIVFKNTPTSDEIRLDIIYLRRCHKIDSDADTDELDLPDKVIPDFLELLKTKIRVEYGNADPLTFDRDLSVYGNKVKNKLDVPQIKHGRVRSYWGGLADDPDHLYDITGNQLSTDHVYTDANGNYLWYD